MSQPSTQELVKRLRPRYLKAEREEKGRILDEFVAVTGMHRKAAIRRMRTPPRKGGRERRGRPKKYTGSAVAALGCIWHVCGCICGKRLKPILDDMVDSLERHGELRLDPETRALLSTVSPATIDRLLRQHRRKTRRGKSTTKPGGLLKHQIRVRTFADWDETEPGFVEIDLVAHCGTTTRGQFICTLTATDVATGWTECLVLPHRSQRAVAAALDTLRLRLPFPLLGIDSDNDSVFINETLLRYCATNEITFTRCRPYTKNDQCFVEQKNWSIVRQTLGYGRYESAAAVSAMERVHADLHLYTNLFQPTFKLKSKEREGAKVRKRYDAPQTPLARVLVCGILSEDDHAQWAESYRQTNPAALRRRIDANLKALRRLQE